jgi:hypothetical protein
MNAATTNAFNYHRGRDDCCYLMNTAIDFVYGYVSLFTDVLIVAGFVILCLKLRHFVLFMIVAKAVFFNECSHGKYFNFRMFLLMNVTATVDSIYECDQVSCCHLRMLSYQ